MLLDVVGVVGCGVVEYWWMLGGDGCCWILGCCWVVGCCCITCIGSIIQITTDHKQTSTVQHHSECTFNAVHLYKGKHQPYCICITIEREYGIWCWMVFDAMDVVGVVGCGMVLDVVECWWMLGGDGCYWILGCCWVCWMLLHHMHWQLNHPNHN